MNLNHWQDIIWHTLNCKIFYFEKIYIFVKKYLELILWHVIFCILNTVLIMYLILQLDVYLNIPLSNLSWICKFQRQGYAGIPVCQLRYCGQSISQLHVCLSRQRQEVYLLDTIYLVKILWTMLAVLMRCIFMLL